MGCCFSKRRSLSPPPPAPNPISIDVSHVKHVVEKKKEKEKEKEVVVVAQCLQAFEEKKQVSNCSNVVTTPEKKAEPLVVVVEEQRPLPVRTSSCTKEEVDAILIQCGRLSRSSSGKTSNEVGGGSRKYSGSKRSYDFDEERRKGEGEEEEEKPTSRPSPRRRTPGRERSGSRERDRRVSRSPGRRSDCPGSASASASASGSLVGSNGDRLKQQPAKMVSVPPREKGSISAAGAGKRSASPGSRSMANSGRTSNENAHPSQPQSLSRSSSRKAEHSPYRRNPMTEIDDNTLRREQPTLRSKGVKSREGEEVVRKPIQAQTQRTGGEISNGIKNSNNVITDRVRDQLMSCRAKEQQPDLREESIEEKGASKNVEIPIPVTITRTRSSRRSSRDLDHNPISYASLLLEDIQNYHHHNNTAFSLPACVSKACSILEAVADLNSSFSDNKSYVDGDQHSNHDNGFARRGLVASEPFVESEIVVKDDLMEPSLHKYVSVRELGGEMEPQESAGSNSFIGQTWASPWDPNSVDSKEQCWSTSRSTANFMEAKEEEFSPVSYNNSQSGKQQKAVSDAPEKRLRGSSSNLSNASRKRELDRKVTARASALHSAAAAASS